MEELEKEMVAFMNELNQVWVKECRAAQEEQRFMETTNVMSEYSTIINKIKDSFGNAKVRMKMISKPVGKGLFGGK